MTGGIDLTITAGTILEIAVITGGGVSVIAVMRSTLATLTRQLSDTKQEATEEMTELKRDTKEQFASIQVEIKRISEVLVNQADQNRRIIRLEEDVRDLRHGRGFVRGEGGIDREYPP